MVYIETERLILRDWTEKDLPVFVRMNRDPAVMEYFLKPLTEEESSNFFTGYGKNCKNTATGCLLWR